MMHKHARKHARTHARTHTHTHTNTHTNTGRKRLLVGIVYSGPAMLAEKTTFTLWEKSFL